ncbi:MAG: response regulator transcription factor [Proteobacteria bacterium]|nr:MAG: response regulator transcription factor [Pseudomonadota bacterium]
MILAIEDDNVMHLTVITASLLYKLGSSWEPVLHWTSDNLEASSQGLLRTDVVIIADQRSIADIEEALRKVRSLVSTTTGILILHNDLSLNQKVQLINLGADAVEPVNLTSAVLDAKLKSLYRRRFFTEQERISQLRHGPILIDLKQHKVWVREIELRLTLTELRILKALVERQGQVVFRDFLKTEVLQTQSEFCRAIDVHICSLRKKISQHGLDIESQRSLGYFLSYLDQPKAAAF